MIDLYFWTTDNGYKARHGLEESGLDYAIKLVSLPDKEQFNPEFLKISPGHKIPALVDSEGPGGATVTLCESGAILKYTAEKAGNGQYPDDPAKRAVVDQWLFYGSATFTTLSQQFGFFHLRCPEDVPFAKAHYENVVKDMLGMLDGQLADKEFVAGKYSVADIALYADTHMYGPEQIGFDDYPNVKRWHDAIEARPAVQKAWGPH